MSCKCNQQQQINTYRLSKYKMEYSTLFPVSYMWSMMANNHIGIRVHKEYVEGFNPKLRSDDAYGFLPIRSRRSYRPGLHGDHLQKLYLKTPLPFLQLYFLKQNGRECKEYWRCYAYVPGRQSHRPSKVRP